MENKLPKYIEGTFVVIRSTEELRAMNYKEDVICSVRPLAGQVVIIDSVLTAEDSFCYVVRKYHDEKLVKVPEDFILCDANLDSDLERLKDFKRFESIDVPKLQAEILDISKLNPSPIEIWKSLFSSIKLFIAASSPVVRSFACGQLKAFTEQLTKELNDSPVSENDVFNATILVCLADDVMEYPNECGGKEFATGTFKLKEGAYFSKYRIKSLCAVYTIGNMGPRICDYIVGGFWLGITIRQEGFTEEDLKDFLFKFKGRRVVLLYKEDEKAYYNCIYTHDITSSYVNFHLDESGIRFVSLKAERVLASEIRLKEENLNLSELLKD